MATTEATAALADWRQLADALQRTPYPTDDQEHAEDVAYDNWSEFADAEDLCRVCAVALEPAWPWACCYDHEPSDHQAEWDSTK
jgi:hypothetical protein